MREAPPLPRARTLRALRPLTFAFFVRSRLTFEMFLESLLALAVKKFPDEPPIEAFTMLMSRNVLGLVSNDPDEDEDSAALQKQLKAKCDKMKKIQELRAKRAAEEGTPEVS